MNWLLIAIVAYFLVALEVVLDKFLLTSKRVSHPAIYAFYSGVLSLATLFIFFPFGFHFVGAAKIWPYLLAGMVFTYGILSLFFALNKSEASRVTPVVGAVVPIVTYALSISFLSERLTHLQISGVMILILGGLFISFDLPLKISKRRFFAGFDQTILAGVLLAVAFTAFKYFFEHDRFINVFIWTRLGLFLGALSLFLVPAWRKAIWSSLKKISKPGRENTRTGVLFVLNKALGGTGSILTNYAIALGSVTLVNALVSVEYIFVFIFGLLFALQFPKIFREKADFWDIFQKVGAIVVITLGVVLISLKK